MDALPDAVTTCEQIVAGKAHKDQAESVPISGIITINTILIVIINSWMLLSFHKGAGDDSGNDLWVVIVLNLLLDSKRQIRSGWWLLLFFLILASILVPILLVSQQNGNDVTIGQQAVIIAAATGIVQLLRRKPVSEIVGRINGRWFKELLFGSLIGAGLMLVPALFLAIFGWVDWHWNPPGFSNLAAGLLLFAGVACAEELLFRGFVFQRLMESLGQWPAQLILAAFFLLTHISNPGMMGSSRVLASVNIFCASLIFGLAFIRTRSLAMPLGLHFMANWVQGGLLGFGVSGNDQVGLWTPVFGGSPDWLTGGSFGLEASVPGLICVLLTLFLLYRRRSFSDKPGVPRGSSEFPGS